MKRNILPILLTTSAFMAITAGIGGPMAPPLAQPRPTRAAEKLKAKREAARNKRLRIPR